MEQTTKFETLTLEQYRKLTGRTLPNLDETYQTQSSLLPKGMLDNLHMVLGMESEIEELISSVDEVNTLEEIGDIWWYLSNYANLNNYDIVISHFTRKKFNALLEIVSLTHVLIDSTKKELAYKKPIDREKIQNTINELASFLNDYTIYMKVDLGTVFARNINKLYVRYPEKFNEFLALEENRDLITEYKTLEGN